MNRDAMGSVLRCELCNKPFDKQATLKRHGYYCRSRRGDTVTRSRSCIACAKGKARCDVKRPQCSRCTTKGLECHYPTHVRKTAGPGTQSSTSRVEISSRDSSPIEDIPVDLSHFGQDLAQPTIGAFNIPDADFDPFKWTEPSIDFTDFLGPSLLLVDKNMPLLASDSLALGEAIITPNMPSHIFNHSIPPVPTITERSLVLKPKAQKGGPHRVAALILHMLKSYPQMMLNDISLPPFIHPHLTSPEFGSKDMETLTNCITLMQMISPKVQGSRKLFWKNVRLECERVCAENLGYNEWELLAAMEALSIYILLRISEGETEHNNFDNLLLNTMVAIAKQLVVCDLTLSPPPATCDNELKNEWKHWIYIESRRRLSVVFRVVDMLVYFNPGFICAMQTDLVLAPLPAKRALWEAPDELAWKAERDKETLPRCAFALTTTGDLVRLEEDILNGGHGSMVYQVESGNAGMNWEEWCSGMDSFGGLILLAASMVG